VSSDIQARVKAFHLGRQGAPPSSSRSLYPSSDGALSPLAGAIVSPPSGALAGGVPANFRLPGGKPTIVNLHSAPAVPGLKGPLGPKKLSLADKRGIALSGGLAASTSNGAPGALPARKKPGLSLSQMNSGGSTSATSSEAKPVGGTMMDKYSDYIDTKTGSLRFKGKANLNAHGVEFADGRSFNISLDDVDTLDELGKGNYGTVYKVRHSRPKMRRPGQGLAGNKSSSFSHQSACDSDRKASDSPASDTVSPSTPTKLSGTTGAVMAMKEIRLELDDAKFAAIIMELDILHKCVSSYIIDFYGAFFQEGAVYICMEFMDGGSIDKLYGDGIPESVLRKITYATIMGLKNLKDEHNIIHRDVKPTNILMNTRGQIKICDFGVSGNLVASIAKTNIGCQSYMAPERISSGQVMAAGADPGNGTYSVSSDIWSLGLTIIECAMGRYPYPPETYNNIFSQLSVGSNHPSLKLHANMLQAIVDGEPPDLPASGYSDMSRNFVSGCLHKIPKLRPTYSMLLQHIWLAPFVKPTTIVEEDEDEDFEADSAPTDLAHTDSPTDVVDREVADWVAQAIEKRRLGTLGKSAKPALHAAPLDAVSTPGHDGMQKKANVKAQMEHRRNESLPKADAAAMVDGEAAHLPSVGSQAESKHVENVSTSEGIPDGGASPTAVKDFASSTIA
jgi:mitogen-activated protein kinase kinase